MKYDNVLTFDVHSLCCLKCVTSKSLFLSEVIQYNGDALQTLFLFRVLRTVNIFPRKISVNVEIFYVDPSNVKVFLELFLLGSFCEEHNAPGPRLYPTPPSSPPYISQTTVHFMIFQRSNALSAARHAHARPANQRRRREDDAHADWFI